MSALAVIAFVTGVLGVWLTIKQNILCWPMALISVISSMLEFYNERLYGDMSLQVVYFFAGVYGWVYWEKNARSDFKVRYTPVKVTPYLVALTLVQAVIYFYLLKIFRGDQPFFDAALTAASLTATYMMIKKWVENWFAWVIIDAAYVFLYGIKDMWVFAALYFFFAIIAFTGWIRWRKAAFIK